VALGINSKIVASGRTDKGVHATAQICHIDLPEFWSDLTNLQRTINKMLPSSIMIKSIKKVKDDFHARYWAKKRVYRYIIKKSKSEPFGADFITYIDDIEFEKVKESIKLFVGEHDFKNFMKTGSEVNSTKRVIFKAFAYKYKDKIILNFEANGFLRSQIRLMVGAILKLDKEEIIEKLGLQKDHKVKPAPANGLYLAKIKY
jgi:tRNA pseudouridine38-40 synthase